MNIIIIESPKNNNLFVVDENERTPLIWASIEGRVEVIDVLLKYKANIEAIDNDGVSPLMWGCKEGNIDAVKILLEKNASMKATDNEGNYIYIYFPVLSVILFLSRSLLK